MSLPEQDVLYELAMAFPNWQTPIQGIRRECLDHFVVPEEGHSHRFDVGVSFARRRCGALVA